MRPSIIFATAEYVKRLREECLRENKPPAPPYPRQTSGAGTG